MDHSVRITYIDPEHSFGPFPGASATHVPGLIDFTINQGAYPSLRTWTQIFNFTDGDITITSNGVAIGKNDFLLSTLPYIRPYIIHDLKKIDP